MRVIIVLMDPNTALGRHLSYHTHSIQGQYVPMWMYLFLGVCWHTSTSTRPSLSYMLLYVVVKI